MLFTLFGGGAGIGGGLPHNMSHSHVERLVGWESQQGRLLHDGIIMAAVGVGIPAGQHIFD